MCDDKKYTETDRVHEEEIVPKDDRSTMEVDDKLIGDDRLIPPLAPGTEQVKKDKGPAY